MSFVVRRPGYIISPFIVEFMGIRIPSNARIVEAMIRQVWSFVAPIATCLSEEQGFAF
jgi:hypothetical protein